MTSHRYLQHTAFTPSPGDKVVKAEKRDIELRHDTLLRKFEYNKALDQVLRPYVMRKKPEYTYSLLMELSRREGLKRALAACEERSFCNILQFVNRNISDSRFTLLLVHVADMLMDIFLPQHGFSGKVDTLFKQLSSRLDKEVNYCDELMQLQGADAGSCRLGPVCCQQLQGGGRGEACGGGQVQAANCGLLGLHSVFVT